MLTQWFVLCTSLHDGCNLSECSSSIAVSNYCMYNYSKYEIQTRYSDLAEMSCRTTHYVCNCACQSLLHPNKPLSTLKLSIPLYYFVRQWQLIRCDGVAEHIFSTYNVLHLFELSHHGPEKVGWNNKNTSLQQYNLYGVGWESRDEELWLDSPSNLLQSGSNKGLIQEDGCM